VAEFAYNTKAQPVAGRIVVVVAVVVVAMGVVERRSVLSPHNPEGAQRRIADRDV